MTDQTPTTQSVVVPVELAETPAIRNALGLYRSAILCGEQWSDTCKNAYLAALRELDHLAMLAAAPAPSSLAGGEVDPQIIARLQAEADAPGIADSCIVFGPDLRAVLKRLAALSPEAPAREGEQWGWRVRSKPSKFNHDRPWHWQFDEPTGITAENCEYEPVYTSALTPRHEAPSLHRNLMSHEDNEAWAALDRHEAPAEGAGEAAIAKLFDAVEMADDYNRLSDRPKRLAKDFLLDSELRDAVSALRARSSAPEAREEALGNLLAVIHGDGGHRALEVGTKQAALEAEKIVAGLFAAPSADKLREVLRDLMDMEFAKDWRTWSEDRATRLLGIGPRLDAFLAAREAALKAEGA